MDVKNVVESIEYVQEGEMQEKPKHYAGMAFDVITFCAANNLDFLTGNVIKYVCRYRQKGGLDDLRKAKDYIERMEQEYRREALTGMEEK